jgi:hypothetical protein
MASAITSGFSFNPEELKEWSQVINELTFADPELNSIHQIDQGIKYDKQIVFAGRMGLMGKAVSGCTPNDVSGIQLSEKFWTPVFEDFRLPHCAADVDAQDKLINQMARMNPDYFNVIEGSQSTVGNYLVAVIIDGFKENLLRKIWFSDTAADTVANGGVLTNGTDKGYFDTFDGLFKQIFTEVSPANVSITKNSGASYAAQELASGEAIAVLKEMYNKADSRLLGLADKKFYVTRTIFDGYLNDLEDIQNTGAGNTMINEDGQMVLRYRGIELVNMEIWDRVIAAYENDGTKYNLPHRVVLSTPDNLRVGTLSDGDFGTVDAFYDRKDRTNYVDGVYSIDAKFLETYKAVVAY